MNIAKVTTILLIFPLLALLSCAARIDGTLFEGGNAELTLKTSLEPRTTALIGSLQGFMGGGNSGVILDGPEIGRSMSLSPGIRAVNLHNSSPSALEGTLSISNIGDFLATGSSKTRFVNYAKGQAAENSSIVITLDRESAPLIISLLSPDVEDYLSALMAPAVLGDIISAQEYLDLVASIYGRQLSNEIASARIKASIDFPRPIKSISGGTASGNRASFDIPLLDILVLEQPLRYEVSW